MESALRRYMNSDEERQIDVSSLVRRNILVEAEASDALPSAAVAEPAEQSVLEQSSHSVGVRFSTLFSVSGIIISTQLQLKASNLKKTLDRLCAYRMRRASVRETKPAWAERYAKQFLQARLNVPLGTRCLLDSIAMVKYLAGHRIHARLVFGVCADPFSAHCWVQSGSLILNDTVGNVSAHTPIRVI